MRVRQVEVKCHLGGPPVTLGDGETNVPVDQQKLNQNLAGAGIVRWWSDCHAPRHTNIAAPPKVRTLTATSEPVRRTTAASKPLAGRDRVIALRCQRRCQCRRTAATLLRGNKG